MAARWASASSDRFQLLRAPVIAANMRQMKAVICREFSGPHRLEIGEMPEPAPAADEILVDVHAASVTYMDRLLVSGGYQMRPPTPFVPGTEAAGVVGGVGGKGTRFRLRPRLACLRWRC